MAHVDTRILLQSLGFIEDSQVLSDPPGGLSIDFKNFKLSASHVLGRYFRPVIRLSGVMAGRNSISLVEVELPCEIDSREQGIAMVTHYLDSHADGRLFVPAILVPWLALGREYRNLLPWEKERKAYESRPICMVRRDLARVGLRYLSELLVQGPGDTTVTITFDGEVLLFRVGERVTVMPADGRQWRSAYMIKARDLKPLPKRLMHDPVRFSIWTDALEIDNRWCKKITTNV